MTRLSDQLSALAREGTQDTYPVPEHGWTCFHCGETFKTPGAARDHFGFDPSADPACRIKIGAERGLVMALRKAEREIEEMRRLLHDDASEAYRLYASQQHRHRDQLRTIEELGYERGLADGRAEASPGEGVVTMSDDVAKIAADLSEQQREALDLFASPDSFLWAENEDEIALIREMTKLSLVSTIIIKGHYAMQLMPLGTAVRAYLEKDSSHD